VIDVVHVSPLSFGARGLWGGGERYALELARAMSTRVSTRFVSFADVRESTFMENLQVEIIRPRAHLNSPFNPLSELLPAMVSDARVVHVHQYETVVTSLCLLTGRLLRKPVFATDLGVHARNGIRKLRLDRLLTGFLPISQFSASFYPQFANRAEVIYGGVDTAKFRPGRARREKEVVFVGRLLPHKGVDVLIRAVDPAIPLHLYGRPYDAAYRSELERLAAGKAVIFHEDSSDAEIVDAYRRARVAVLPSVHDSDYARDQRKAELLGLVLLEAMACGTPVVCSEVGGMPEVVDQGITGWVVPANDVGALRERIQLLLEDDKLWARMSSAAAAHVERRFTWPRVADRCLTAYANMSSVRGQAGIRG
jgi:glycosyltransferase involved in cell wall biosynthesis